MAVWRIPKCDIMVACGRAWRAKLPSVPCYGSLLVSENNRKCAHGGRRAQETAWTVVDGGAACPGIVILIPDGSDRHSENARRIVQWKRGGCLKPN